MGKDEKKRHNKYHRDQTNGSRLNIGGTNFESPVHGGGGESEFVEFLKITYGEGQEDS